MTVIVEMATSGRNQGTVEAPPQEVRKAFQDKPQIGNPDVHPRVCIVDLHPLVPTKKLRLRMSLCASIQGSGS